MKDRKIIVALESLNVYQLNKFGKYIHSPYFNMNENVTNYFDGLNKIMRDGKIDEYDSESLWRLVYLNEKFNNHKFLKLNSDLVKLLEDFLAQVEFDDNTSLKANLKLEGARNIGVENLYNGIVSEISRLDKMDMNQSVNYYYYKYLIEKNLFSVKTENEKKNEKFEIEAELNLSSISRNLDLFYISEKLRLYCTLLSWKKMYKLDIEMDNLDLVLPKINNYDDVPPVRLYNKMHLTYVDAENENHYFELREMMKNQIFLFPTDEVSEIYSTAINYCITKTNKGNLGFQRETFELFKEGLENNAIIRKNEVQPTMFRNIVFFALRVEEFDWAENFIVDYQHYVDPKYRDNAVQFSLARLEFYRKNFGRVLDHLNKVSYEDVWYTLGSRTLQIASYYELEEYDALESSLLAFNMYTRREKSLTKERKDSYQNLIKFTLALMKLNHRDQEKIKKLKNEIIENKGVVSKPWLLEKVKALIKN